MHKIIVLCGGLMMAAASFAGGPFARVSSAADRLPQSRNGLIVISHRGNHVKVAENTVASVREAIRAGADYVEIDLRTTKDGQLVLSHDESVDRMTDGKGNVRDLSFAAVRALKVRRTPADVDTYMVPTFREILSACKGQINIYLDFKEADVAEAYKQIQEAGMEKQIVVYLNKAAQYKQWKTIAPAMPLMGGIPRGVTTPEQMRSFLDQADLAVLDNVHDSALQAVARERGVALWLDVQGGDEGPAKWDRVLAGDVQGMQTDHPDDLVAYLKQTGRRNGLSSAAASARTAAAGSTAASAEPGYRKLSDVSYGSDPEQVLDAYIPQNYDKARVILYIHGGGWTGGDKKEFPAILLDELVGKRKYIVVSMNYRLVRDGKNRFPAQIEDVGKALAFLSKHASRYNYEGGSFALMGGSAGGHLAMLYAYGYDSAHVVKAVIDCWGPSDLSDKAVRSANPAADEKVVNLLGVSDPQAAICRDASPYLKITKASGVPTILFHGEEDPLVDVSQAKKMYAKLNELGVPAQLELYPHAKHGVDGADAMDVGKKLIVFVEKYFPAVAGTNAAAGGGFAASTTQRAVGFGGVKDDRTYAERLGFPKGAKVIIFHVDDAGMSVNSNDGAINSIEKGIATSTSIMMPCPWAASFAKRAIEKGYDAGLHLTLTSEWHHYRWPPLAGIKQVPGLVDAEWCLWPEVEDVVAHASADEVEAEIRAQLARALALGLHPTHLDSHMGTLFANEDYLKRYIKVGIENQIPVMFPGGNNKMLAQSTHGADGLLKHARMVGEMIWAAGLPVLDDLVTYSGEWKPAPVKGKVTPEAYEKYKVQQFKATIDSMQPGVAMYIVHSTVVTDDFRRISGSGDSRFADMQAMMDPELKAYLEKKGVILTTWRELMERRKKVR